MQAVLKNLEKGVYYNTTRVFRIMEAQQQVATIMGVPLRWNTSAVLAFSLRAGLKLETQPENFDFILEAFLQPSAALTHLNGMAIHLPSAAQVGVEANKSAFASMAWKSKLYHNEERTIFSISRPSRSKNILQLFNSHRLMRHGAWHDGEDVESETRSCSDGLLSSLLGLQFCVDQSQSKSDYWTWQAFLQPSDKKIESYNLEFMRPQEKETQNTIIKYSTFGSPNRREIFFIIGNDKLDDEVKFRIKIPALPQFSLYLQCFKGTINYKMIMNLTLFESHYYELIYGADYVFQEHHSDGEQISKDSKVQGRVFTFRSPFNKYSVSLKNYGKKRTEKSEVVLSYNNFNSYGRWLYGILPQSFWETNTIAWLQILVFWNVEIAKNSRQAICIVKDPHSTTHLSTGFFHFDGGERKYFCVSKKQNSGGKPLAAAHFTYDFWKQNDTFDEDQTQIFNLTIAQKSWAVGVLKERKGGKFSYEVSFFRKELLPEVEGTCDNVASWLEIPRSIYSAEQPELKFVADAEMQVISSQEMAKKYSMAKEQELAGLWNQIIKANISFYFPFVSGQESVKAEGYVITSGGPTTTRFQNNLMMTSSFHNLQLSSHSVYRSDQDFTSLHYNTNLTHALTDKIFHSVHFWLSTPEGKCSEAEFRHTFLSRMFDLSTVVTYRCKPNHTDLHDLRLNMRTNSSQWNMLNLSISQLVEDQTPDYTFETCNVTHPLLLINVTADWVGKRRDHKKRALFTRREENSRSTELLIQALHDGTMSADLIIPENRLIPDSKRQKLSFERTISSDAKTQNCRIAFSNDETHGSEGLHLKGEILNENYQIWNLKLHPDTCAEICALLGNGYQNILDRAFAIAKDRHHPVNKMIHSNFKMTLYEYYENLHQQGYSILMVTWKSFKETVVSLYPVYEAPLTLLLNVLSTWKTYLTANDDSVLTTVQNYLNFPYFDNISEKIYLYLKPKEKILEWEFVTNRIIKLESFNKWPSIFRNEIYINLQQKSLQSLQGSSELNKIALVIGSAHVFRFDERLIPSVLRSSDCVVLLARDMRNSAFTVLSAQHRIYIIFPEITVSVSEENDVFINDSQVPSKLPVQTSNGNIRVRKDETLVEIQSPSLGISCRAQQTGQLCLFTLDFRQYLATFGLLGDADGFSSTEISIPERKAALEFVSKYEVSGKAECKNLKPKVEIPASRVRVELCSRVLLQVCHLKWNILRQLIEMCELGFKEDAISGYSALCSYGNLRNATSPKGQFHNYEEPKIEIVLVIQEHHSLKMEYSTLEGLGRLMDAFDDHFAENGFSDILFSLVGFGSKNSNNQSVFHVEQRPWLVVHDVLKRLEFDGEEDIGIPKIFNSIFRPMDCELLHSKFFLLVTTQETLNKNKDSLIEAKQFLKKSGTLLYAIFPRSLDVNNNSVCTMPEGGGSLSSTCLETFLPKPVPCMEAAVFCLFPEHSDTFFRTIAANTWSVTAQRSRTCSAHRNWWKRINVCPTI